MAPSTRPNPGLPDHPYRAPGPNEPDRSAYLRDDTIAAVSSALGGAIAIIRVSGKKCAELYTKLTQQKALPTSRVATHVTLYTIDGQLLDDALVLSFKAPNSYTGEDLLEFHIHGSAWIANRLLETLFQQGARQALPGEFSFRAVKNGKLTLSQAQAVSDLITSSNDGALSLALEKLSGSQNRLISKFAEDLRTLLVLSEAGIDFSDQDLDDVSLPKLKEKTPPLVQELETLLSSYTRGVRLQEGIKTVFFGIPNAGKSSFFNLLIGEDRSIVSETAGTTRDVIREFFTLRSQGKSYTLRLEDTAGLRQNTSDLISDIEKEGMRRSQEAAQRADLVLYLFDPTQVAASTSQWEALPEKIRQKTLIIFTKADLISEARQREFSSNFQGIWSSTKLEKESLDQAVSAIIARCEALCSRQRGEVLLTHLDQVESVRMTLEHLRRAQNADEVDLFSSDLRLALHALRGLIGETTPDDILGRIFSEFCIGK